jgi:competence transcription factor ComK
MDFVQEVRVGTMNLSKQKENMFASIVGTKQIQCLVDLVRRAPIKITNLRSAKMVPAISAESNDFDWIFNPKIGKEKLLEFFSNR